MATDSRATPTGRAPKDPNIGDLNLDPITGEPGSHPVGTGVGAAGARSRVRRSGGAGPVSARPAPSWSRCRRACRSRRRRSSQSHRRR